MRILGISAFYHDSAAAIIEDGKIIAAAQEERFTRKKHDPSFPLNAVKFCMEYGGADINSLDAIVFYEKPLLKFERLLETYYAFSPSGIRSFATAMPVWLKEKLFLKKIIRDELGKLGTFSKKPLILFPEHHLSHAASAFYPSPFTKAAILTIDGVGEWSTASICLGEGNKITLLKEMKFPHSLGLLYSAFTYFLGFRVNSGEYKLMGLAPYGNPESSQVQEYMEIIRANLVDIKQDGSLWLNMKFFGYATGLRMVVQKKWEKLFGFSLRQAESEIESHHCNLALAIQNITNECVMRMAGEAKKLTNAENLCLAGGVALNCVSNGKLYNSKLFKDFFWQPAAGDAGGALGAALAGYHIYFEKERVADNITDTMNGGYLGNDFSDLEVRLMAKKYNAVYRYFENFGEVSEKTAEYLITGNVVGWVQGRMEFGPRALGARSILGDARNSEMQKKLNLKIKYRESFRPFAPSVLAEDYSLYFSNPCNSPYMLLVQPVSPAVRKSLPEGFQEFCLREKLYYQRSHLPAITHIDFSARIQTVHEETNPRFWELINKFKSKTGYGVVVNTSFNVRGEPIVCTPEDAYRCFMNTEMDVLVIGNFIFAKDKQPIWHDKNKIQDLYLD